MQRLLLIGLGLLLALALGSPTALAAARNTTSRSKAGTAAKERKPRFNHNARAVSAGLSPRQLGSAYSLLHGLHAAGTRLVLRSAAQQSAERERRARLALATPKLEPPAAARTEPVPEPAEGTPADVPPADGPELSIPQSAAPAVTAPAAETAAPEDASAAERWASQEQARKAARQAGSNSLDGLARASSGHEGGAETPEPQAPAAAEESAEQGAADSAAQEQLDVHSFGLQEKAAGDADNNKTSEAASADADAVLGKSSPADKVEEAAAERKTPHAKLGGRTVDDPETPAGSRAEPPQRAMPTAPVEAPETTPAASKEGSDLPGSESSEPAETGKPRMSMGSLGPRHAEALLAPPADINASAQLEPAASLGAAGGGLQLNAMLTPLPRMRELAIAPMLSGPGGRPIEAPTDILPRQGAPHMPEGAVPRDLVSLEHGNLKKKLVALTFDDGPHPEYTSQLLAVLAHYKVRATFDMVGVQMIRNPQWVKMTHLAGHEIASHTYDHFRLPKLPYDEKVYQIDENQRLVERLTGQTPRFLRPPGGQIDPETQRICAQRGMVVAMWDVGLNDLKAGRDGGDLATTALKEVKPGSIILAHDGSQAMIDALPGIIEGLQAKGYEFVTLTELASAL